MSNEAREWFSDLGTAFLENMAFAKDWENNVSLMEIKLRDQENVAEAAAKECSEQNSAIVHALAVVAGEALQRVDVGVFLLNCELNKAKDRIADLEKLIQPERRQHPINDPIVRDSVWSLTHGRCAYCDTEIRRDGTAETRGIAFCVEHVVPTSAGGPDNIANYVPACVSCNSSKGDRHILMLLRRMQRRTDLVVVADNTTETSRRMTGDTQ